MYIPQPQKQVSRLFSLISYYIGAPKLGKPPAVYTVHKTASGIYSAQTVVRAPVGSTLIRLPLRAPRPPPRCIYRIPGGYTPLACTPHGCTSHGCTPYGCTTHGCTHCRSIFYSSTPRGATPTAAHHTAAPPAATPPTFVPPTTTPPCTINMNESAGSPNPAV